MFQSHLPLLKRFVAKAIGKHNAENEQGQLNPSAHYDDALGEAFVAFCEALKSYDPALGAKFSTWLWWKLRHRVGNYLHKERRQLEIQQILGQGWSPLANCKPKPPKKIRRRCKK